MYCNKVKKGKRCITYTLQLNLTRLNLDCSSSVRRIFQPCVVKTLPLLHSAHFPVFTTGARIRGSDDSPWHGSKNGVADSAHVITWD